MTEALDTSFTVEEIPARGQDIPVTTDTIVAFIGRALCGPPDRPVAVASFAEFARVFGGHWVRSSLGAALEQFFAHGGKRALVVRAVNGATGGRIVLPAGGAALTLVAVRPGSAERLRVSVDYDGIPPADETRFNLTVQRLSARSGLVEDQEIHRRLAIDDKSEDFVAARLAGSAMLRVRGEPPPRRPDATAVGDAPAGAGYLGMTLPGDDGRALSDYDLIGSETGGSGLFALDAAERFDLLYAPPPEAGREPGPAFLLAAERYCNARGAMLVVDPPPSWRSVEDAAAGVRAGPYTGHNLLTYFPRMRDRGGPDAPPRAAGGAIAGIIARHDELHRPWTSLDEGDGPRVRGWEPAVGLDDEDAARLARAGVNALTRGHGGRLRLRGSVTLPGGAAGRVERLSEQRLALYITRAVVRATRWVVFDKPGTVLWRRVEVQIEHFLETLAELGAFAGDGADDGAAPPWFVRCNAGTNTATGRDSRSVHLLLGFRPKGAREPVVYSITQGVVGARIARAAFVPEVPPGSR